MNKSYYILEPFLTEEERIGLLEHLKETEWHRHKSSKTGELSPLHLRRAKFRNYEKAWVMKMEPNSRQEMHTDEKGIDRETLIIYPLTDNYAPIVTEDGSTDQPAIVNTQQPHAVYNNNNVRLNLQIPLSCAFEDLFDYVWGVSNHKVWNQIRELCTQLN